MAHKVLVKLNPRQLSAVRMRVEGVPWRDVAKRLNVSLPTVRFWSVSPIFKEAMAKIAEEVHVAHVEHVADSASCISDARKTINAHAPEAARVLGQLLKSEKEGVRRHAAGEILTRAGIAPPQSGSAIVINIDADSIRNLVETAKLRGLIVPDGQVIDVTESATVEPLPAPEPDALVEATA